jgi:hypothetical protein
VAWRLATRGDAYDAAEPPASPDGSALAAAVILGNEGLRAVPASPCLNMLFYEPLFVTFFLMFFAPYLLAAGASAKKWTLLIASLLFYVWERTGLRASAAGFRRHRLRALVPSR